MSRYLTPLPGVMASAIEFVLNQAVALDPKAAEHLATLDGRWLKIEIDGLAIDLWLAFHGERFRVLAEPDRADMQAETRIGGTPASLLAMALPAIDSGAEVRIEGNPRLAQQFQQVMKLLDPDVEQALGDWFGPLIGPQIWRMVSEAAEFGRHATRTSADQFSHWLREESELVPRADEWRAFRDGVDDLREAVDRLEARVRRSARS